MLYAFHSLQYCVLVRRLLKRRARPLLQFEKLHVKAVNGPFLVIARFCQKQNRPVCDTRSGEDCFQLSLTVTSWLQLPVPCVYVHKYTGFMVRSMPVRRENYARNDRSAVPAIQLFGIYSVLLSLNVLSTNPERHGLLGRCLLRSAGCPE